MSRATKIILFDWSCSVYRPTNRDQNITSVACGSNDTSNFFNHLLPTMAVKRVQEKRFSTEMTNLETLNVDGIVRTNVG